MTRLRELAHARTGDKGDTSNISVIAYRVEDYARLRECLTAERVQQFFASLLEGADSLPPLRVQRYEVAGIRALNFVLPGLLKGGVTRSLALDAHGKTLGSALLEIEI
jgi:hypothetical protein